MIFNFNLFFILKLCVVVGGAGDGGCLKFELLSVSYRCISQIFWNTTLSVSRSVCKECKWGSWNYPPKWGSFVRSCFCWVWLVGWLEVGW